MDNDVFVFDENDEQGEWVEENPFMDWLNETAEGMNMNPTELYGLLY